MKILDTTPRDMGKSVIKTLDTIVSTSPKDIFIKLTKAMKVAYMFSKIFVTMNIITYKANKKNKKQNKVVKHVAT